MRIKLQLYEFVKYVYPNLLDVVTVKDKEYMVYTYEGPIAKIENALVVISYEVSGDSFKKSIVFLAISFLEIFKVLCKYLIIKTLEESIEYHRSVSTKEFVLYYLS